MNIDYAGKHNDYKSRHAAFKIAKDIVFITGKAASGKSSVAKIFENNGYK